MCSRFSFLLLQSFLAQGVVIIFVNPFFCCSIYNETKNFFLYKRQQWKKENFPFYCFKLFKIFIVKCNNFCLSRIMWVKKLFCYDCTSLHVDFMTSIASFSEDFLQRKKLCHFRSFKFLINYLILQLWVSSLIFYQENEWRKKEEKHKWANIAPFSLFQTTIKWNISRCKIFTIKNRLIFF